MNFLLAFFFCFFTFETTSAYDYNISACCIFQDEDRFLKEWIDYHRLIGIEHFYMYDNISTDASYQVLEPYINDGIVDYIYWDKNYSTPKEWWHVQRDAYMDAIQRATHQSKWLAIIDTDEFIVPIKDNNLQAFLDDFEPYGGVCINWIFYGTSGIKKIPDGVWMIETLLNRAQYSYSLHNIVKSIVQPEKVDAQQSFFPHTCAYIENYYHVNADKSQLKKNSPRDFCIDKIRLHHYWARDLDYLHQSKLPRYIRWIGEENAKEKLKQEALMNDCYDPVILQVIDKLKKQK